MNMVDLIESMACTCTNNPPMEESTMGMINNRASSEYVVKTCTICKHPVKLSEQSNRRIVSTD